MTADGNAKEWNLSPEQIITLWEKAGGVREHGYLMAAIALAESDGWVTAENVAGVSTHDLAFAPAYTTYSPTRDYSIGLWQLNFYRSLGPARAKRWAALVNGPHGNAPTQFAQWLRTHPDAQAVIAHDLYADGRGLSNWTGDPAYEAWKTGGDPALEAWLGPGVITGKHKRHHRKPVGPPGPRGPAGPPKHGHRQHYAPKAINGPWHQFWRHLNTEGNHAHDATKALAHRLTKAVGG